VVTLEGSITVTDVERTLIDVVVRPAYAGGVESVADAYSKLAKKIRTEHMLSLLKKIGHAYPYHQSIGFLLEKAGVGENECRKFENLGIEYDFYLGYQMNRSSFNQRWRLFYPTSLDPPIPADS
jgi:predicted transcriptional regulator of viral defense system